MMDFLSVSTRDGCSGAAMEVRDDGRRAGDRNVGIHELINTALGSAIGRP